MNVVEDVDFLLGEELDSVFLCRHGGAFVLVLQPCRLAPIPCPIYLYLHFLGLLIECIDRFLRFGIGFSLPLNLILYHLVLLLHDTVVVQGVLNPSHFVLGIV